MTPGARIQASIELLQSILDSWQTDKRFPADKQIDIFFKARRYIGSGDRGAIGELVYWVLRNKASLEWHISRHPSGDAVLQKLAPEAPAHAPDRGRRMILAALMLRKDYDIHSIHPITADSKYSLKPLAPDEARMCAALAGQKLDYPGMPMHARLNYPDWLHARLQESFGKDLESALKALNAQAATDLRVNTLKTTREALKARLMQEGFDTSPTATSPVGLRLSKRGPIFTAPSFKEGLFEVQDEGSQILSLLVRAEPGHKVIDFCAGAGGKTLAMAATMENKGRILAWDTSEKRLSQILPRLRRAGVDNVQTHVLESERDSFIKRHKYTADRVLVDAPCSGSGTWRRNPDLKWRFTQKDLDEVLAVQQSILQSAARLVKPGGRLVYATCSVFKSENEQQVEQFLKSVNNFKVVCAQKIWDKSLPDNAPHEVSYLWVTPHQDGVDGFFAAVLERLPGEPQEQTEQE